eukprot:CAMPEP_0204083316 /NCGR_PEP_ID=MMETSP0360-20130528/178356_1 /ASSEMBLY_ACC=CAM_ASM_000342 /TAXON_ID=268821 /ORGANISM="Scrippsiella Hangoei, Strain SHTV-5" /LENGTH=171 /DNA_ID=CAMNT_0051032245 /DNA_START=294 /DNA_END=809 /DNA_ORIENTATION=-
MVQVQDSIVLREVPQVDADELSWAEGLRVRVGFPENTLCDCRVDPRHLHDADPTLRQRNARLLLQRKLREPQFRHEQHMVQPIMVPDHLETFLLVEQIMSRPQVPSEESVVLRLERDLQVMDGHQGESWLPIGALIRGFRRGPPRGHNQAAAGRECCTSIDVDARNGLPFT